MSQITARINLSAKTFPLIAQNWGRTILVPQYDTNFSRQVVSPADQDHDVGIPQAYYCHNVMPHAQGFQSIGYNRVVIADPIELTFLYRLELLDDAGNSALLGICSNKKWYIREPGGVWTLVYTSLYSADVYATYCSGITYIWQRGAGYYIYDWFTHTLSAAADFAALNTNNVIGLTSSYGYLIAWTAAVPAHSFTGDVVAGDLFVTSTFVGPVRYSDLVGCSISNANLPAGTIVTSVVDHTIYISQPATGSAVGATFNVGARSGGVFWSSTIDPTDFTPSLITGAGGGAVQDARGPITVCVPHTSGFFVYTQANCVVAVYTSNVRFPFAFKAIVASGGVSDRDLITFDANSNLHYAYTTSGLQLIGVNSAATVSPEITDFISGKRFEDFDESTDTFVNTTLTTSLQKHVQVISSRYLVISYGITELTHALVLDLVSQRLGKFKITHVDCFELPPQAGGVTEIARENIAFLQNDGTIYVVNFNEYQGIPGNANGVLIVGKFQFVRARLLVLDSVILENIPSFANFTLTILTSLYGKDFVSVTPHLNRADDTQQEYLCKTEGVNHSLLLKGQFHLESGVLVFHPGAKR